MRTAALAAGVAAVVAAGAYTVTEALDRGTATRDAAPVTVPSDLTPAVQQLRDSLEQQYGSNPAAMATLSDAQLRRIRDNLAGQYGGTAAASSTLSPAELREIRDSLAAQYGGPRAASPHRRAAPRDPRRPRRPVRRPLTVVARLNVRVMAHIVTVDIDAAHRGAALGDVAARVRRHRAGRTGHRHRLRPSARACAVRDRRRVGRRGALRGRPRAPGRDADRDQRRHVGGGRERRPARAPRSRRHARVERRAAGAVRGARRQSRERRGGLAVLPAVHALQPQRQRRRRPRRLPRHVRAGPPRRQERVAGRPRARRPLRHGLLARARQPARARHGGHGRPEASAVVRADHGHRVARGRPCGRAR